MTYQEMYALGASFGDFSRFQYAWPWMGLGAAIVLIIIAFFTDTLRSDKALSRWKDPAVLAWLCSIAYMLHNFEEYGCDLYGNPQGFAFCMSALVSTKGIMSGAFAEAALLSCNIGLLWIFSPIASSMVTRGHRHMAAGMAFFEIVNGLGHIALTRAGGCYSPGLVTSLIIFLPLGIWTIHVCYWQDKQPKINMLWLFLVAVLYHAVMMLGEGSAMKFGLSGAWQATIMMADNILIFILWWLVDRNAAMKQAQQP